MNPVVAYARLSMSFINMYRREQDARSRSKVAIAAAMSGLATVNIVSVYIFAGALTHSHRSIEVAPFGILAGLFFLLELAFVSLVTARVRSDAVFAEQVASVSPSISYRYAAFSIALLVAAAATAIITT
jgi:hypothetical protein